MGQKKRAKKTYIPSQTAKSVTNRLLNHFAKLEEAKYSVLVVDVKGKYVYLSHVNQTQTQISGLMNPFTNARRGSPSKLARLAYTGSPENWHLQMYLYSRENYDIKGDVLVGGGAPEGCLETVLSLYPLPGTEERLAKEEEQQKKREEEFVQRLEDALVLEKELENPVIVRVVSLYRDDLLPEGCFPTAITRILTYDKDTNQAEESIHLGLYAPCYPSEEKSLDKVYEVTWQILPWLQIVCRRNGLLQEGEELDCLGIVYEALEIVEGSLLKAPLPMKLQKRKMDFYPIRAGISQDGCYTHKAIELEEKRSPH